MSNDDKLEKLIELIRPRQDFLAPVDLIQTVLFSFRILIRPAFFFNRLAIRIIDSFNSISQEEILDLINKYLFIISQWTELFPKDFDDKQTSNQLDDLFEKIIRFDRSFNRSTDFIRKTLIDKLKRLSKQEFNIRTIQSRTIQYNIDLLTIENPTAIELSEQLIHIELERMKFIQFDEFLFYSLNKTESNKFNDEKEEINVNRTIFLQSSIQWFNHLTHFVQTQILRHRHKRNRIKLIEYFIELAHQSLIKNNFNSMFAIIGALNMKSIQRLKRTWEKIDLEKLRNLEQNLDLTKNFSYYRRLLKNSLQQSEEDLGKEKIVVIPFVSLIIQDVFFILNHSKDFDKNHLINIQKYKSLFDLIEQYLSRIKRSQIYYKRNERLIKLILESEIYDQSCLMLASFECESPSTDHDKQILRTIQQEQIKEKLSLK